MLSSSIRVGAMAAALSLAGCAATVNKSGPPQAPLAISAVAKKSLVVQVKPATGMPSAGNWEALRTDWRDGIALAAGKAGMRVTWAEGEFAPTQDPAVLVVVHVRNYRYMAPGTRIGMGVLAGNAHVNAEIEFHELPARRLLGSRVYGTTTSAVEGIFSATTRQQVQAMSEEIIAEIMR